MVWHHFLQLQLYLPLFNELINGCLSTVNRKACIYIIFFPHLPPSLSLSDLKMSEQSERSPIQLQDMTLEKEAGQKQEVQKLQELPQQQQREDDNEEEEEEEEHTSTSLKASHAITEQTREEQPREQEEKKEDDEDKELGNITVSPPSETPFKQSERFPIQDMTVEKEEEEQKQEAQTLQELPQQQQTEEDTATSLNASHAGEQTIAEQPKEPEQGQEEEKEQKAQNLQELPQQQQREEEEDTATSHYNASNAREQEQGQEDVDISSATLPLMMKMNKWRLSPVTPAKRPAQKSDVKDEDCQGIKKKTRTKVTCDKPPTTFLESVLTDVDYEIGFLNCIIDYYHNNARYPYYDYIAVDDFIKNWLEVDATQRQLIDVILKLRKKHKETLAKMGVAKKFSDPHHQRAFNLAQRIWTNSGFKEDWKNLKKSRFIASPFP